MALTLYNSLTKKEEVFAPLHPPQVTMYTCGPTVYGRPHLGNYASFLLADLLRRWLTVSGYSVKHAKNITDVGHLVADADTGEDKIEKQAKAEKIDPLMVAERYTQQYLADEKVLNFIEPEVRPRATQYIPEMLAIIRTLMDGGHAYEVEDGIYFDVRSFPEYGKLSGNRIDDLAAGARVDVHEHKKHPADFALWKKCVGENAHHLLRWSFTSGERVHTEGEDAAAGFPGWHIECSAMARKELGAQIDIHTGGEDNIFPHHECEIAQSECSMDVGPGMHSGGNSTQFVQVWLHRRFIDIVNEQGMSEKMSKSLGNVYVLDDFIARGYHPLDLRYYLLSVHYRTNLKFSWKGMEDAKKARRKIMEWMTENPIGWSPALAGDTGLTVNSHSEDFLRNEIQDFEQEFTEAMNADLNTPAALAVVFDVMAWSRNQRFRSNVSTDALANLQRTIRETFGCFEPEEDQVIPAEVQALVDQRAAARARKDFAESDRLRDCIKEKGYDVRDTAEGQRVAKL